MAELWRWVRAMFDGDDQWDPAAADTVTCEIRVRFLDADDNQATRTVRWDEPVDPCGWTKPEHWLRQRMRDVRDAGLWFEDGGDTLLIPPHRLLMVVGRVIDERDDQGGT